MKATGYMLRTGRVLAVMTLALAAAPVWALEPGQVLVVVNGDSMDSVSLAKNYAELRSIPAQNVLTLSCTVKASISREDYEKTIRLPIRNYLKDKKLEDKITCIVVMYGVPVRIEPTSLPQEANERYRAYGAAVTLAGRRLALDLALAHTVAQQFPKPKTTELAPLSKLFDPPAASRDKDAQPRDYAEALAELLRTLAEKHKAVQTLEDDDQRSLASRQLMALYLDVGGWQGLANYIRNEKPVGAPDLETLEERIREAEEQLAELREQRRKASKVATADEVKAEIELANRLGGLAQVRAMASNRMTMVGPESTDAALDSELALLAWDNQYDLAGWVPNPLHWRQRGAGRGAGVPPARVEGVSPSRPAGILPASGEDDVTSSSSQDNGTHNAGETPATREAPAPQPATRRVYMTCRIDGPTRADVRRIIRASAAVEKTGLKGTFYIDAGGLQPRYDDHLKTLATMLTDHTSMPTVMDTTPHVFAPDSCPGAALYVGWYSPRRYVSAFAWSEGAVGWHIASFEAVRLRDSSSPDWAPKMIQNGVAATVAAVNEPFLGAFPLPEEFFPLLLTGQFTVAECYWRTVPHASWRLTLIADPLYNPFAKNPRMNVDDLPKGLAE